MSFLVQHKEELINECVFSAVKSSGPGGQHVNKTSTKVELRFNINDSQVLDDSKKQRLLNRLANQLTNDGELIVLDQSSRSQFKNKETAIEKFLEILDKALKPRKKRIPTKPSRASKQKRLDQKRQQSEKKQRRQNPPE